jgi:ketosteroid isomerase-like protein
MTGPDRISVVRHFLDNFNGGDLDTALEAMAQDVRYEGPVVEGVWWANGSFEGVDALLSGIIDGVDDYFDHLSVVIDHIYECGEEVVVISHHDGRTKNGRKFDSALVQVYTVANDKIVLLRDFADTESWRTKLGV